MASLSICLRILRLAGPPAWPGSTRAEESLIGIVGGEQIKKTYRLGFVEFDENVDVTFVTGLPPATDPKTNKAFTACARRLSALGPTHQGFPQSFATRGGEIWTHHFLHPKQVHSQAAPRPVLTSI